MFENPSIIPTHAKTHKIKDKISNGYSPVSNSNLTTTDAINIKTNITPAKIKNMDLHPT
jgi:hypothetical protein